MPNHRPNLNLANGQPNIEFNGGNYTFVRGLGGGGPNGGPEAWDHENAIRRIERVCKSLATRVEKDGDLFFQDVACIRSGSGAPFPFYSFFARRGAGIARTV